MGYTRPFSDAQPSTAVRQALASRHLDQSVQDELHADLLLLTTPSRVASAPQLVPLAGQRRSQPAQAGGIRTSTTGLPHHQPRRTGQQAISVGVAASVL